jgi:DNA polymerase III epsilon subunit-like protein
MVTEPAAVTANDVGMWDRYRVVVLDTETCPDGSLHAKDHIISIGAVTLRNGVTVGSWATLLDPGVPITNSRIHRLTDTLVAGAPEFPSVVAQVDELLSSSTGERVVFVGHYADYDWRHLNIEYHRLGRKRQPPDVAIIDTAKLAPFVGVSVPDKSLATLAAALGVGNPNPHDALSDAMTTAAVFTRLLDLAATQGIRDMAVVIEGARSKGGNSVPPAPVPLHPGATDESVTVPAGHLETHAHLLSAHAGHRQVAAWLDGAGQCVQLRCAHLHDKTVLAAKHRGPCKDVGKGLVAMLDAVAASGEAPQMATLLDALSIVLPLTLKQNRVSNFCDNVAALVAPMGRCDPARLDACPNCLAAAPCAIDTWHQTVAEVYVGGASTPPQRRRFMATTFPTWVTQGRGVLAGYVAWLVADHWIADGKDAEVAQIASDVFAAGVYEPRLVELHAASVAEAGTTVALQRAAKVCETALKSRHGSTDEGWGSLEAKRRQLLSKRAEMLADAQAVASGVRSHSAATPRRTYAKRFTPK